ncbi:hypothetical protein E1180_04265 [Roseibium denhamense]|uniref:YARHG domain-containing protein n=1 Tax=Roseibium denhamense TaxID=76305 RepID=A0ABY1PG99_9HYPH|nr:hypothetical protein [Roseibium denhamense]SMP33646.1 hypothetical protein SAMN06265374_3806 [Roseibium denhamense]
MLLGLAGPTNGLELGTLPAKTCQQLWYMEQEVLVEGRVCLQTERAKRAFRSAPPCISAEERILPAELKKDLLAIRQAAANKTCFRN